MSLQQELQQMCDGINAYVEALENKEPWALERERQFNESVEERIKNRVIYRVIALYDSE